MTAQPFFLGIILNFFSHFLPHQTNEKAHFKIYPFIKAKKPASTMNGQKKKK